MYTKVATVIRITNSQGRILGVSRKDDPNAWGVPGGKFESQDGDPEIQDHLMLSAARELSEETGIQAPHLKYLGAKYCGEYLVHAFATEMEWDPIQIPGEGMVKWVEELDLCQGPFGEYNEWLLQQS